MRLEVTVIGSGFRDVTAAVLSEAELAVTAGMQDAGVGLQQGWRRQVTGSGLGQRLANTVRLRVFPGAEPSLGAAALVWTKAPAIIAAFERGALIRGVRGLWLAIPLPAAGKTGLGGKKVTPLGWERRTGMRLRFVYRRGKPSLLVADDARLTRATGLATSIRRPRRRDGILTGAATVPVFLLVPQVKLPKKLDIAGLAGEAAVRLPGAILSRWGKGP
jgi:hypothetical protein